MNGALNILKALSASSEVFTAVVHVPAFGTQCSTDLTSKECIFKEITNTRFLETNVRTGGIFFGMLEYNFWMGVGWVGWQQTNHPVSCYFIKKKWI